MTDYRIVVQTGTMKYAGTDSNVFITLYGIAGSSGERYIDNNEDNFEKGKMDLFTISSNELGDLTHVRVRHDNSGDDEGWFLEYITVEHQESFKIWVFPCHRWLADDEDDRRIDRVLQVARAGGRDERAGGALAGRAHGLSSRKIEVHE